MLTKLKAHLDVGGQCGYVIGLDAKGRAMGSVDEFPAECGGTVADARGIEVVLVVMKLPGHDLS